ncbi:MAG: copper resistance protein CopC [Proteobacteria bacterium]|nr:copper resistance protein CopC [Pseudomonadota bacterium]
MKRRYQSLATIVVTAVLSSVAYAHTSLRGSEPASGSVLTQSPPAVTLTFLEPARLTSLMLVTSSGERRLAFSPSGNALSFVAAKPELAPGRNEIRWTALSADGHVIEGSLIIVLRAMARPGA